MKAGRLLSDLTLRLEISENSIAGLLNVTKRTLASWVYTEILDEDQGKLDRLKALDRCSKSIMQTLGCSGKIILNVINEPIFGEDSESLLYFIVECPNSHLLDEAVGFLLRGYDSGN